MFVYMFTFYLFQYSLFLYILDMPSHSETILPMCCMGKMVGPFYPEFLTSQKQAVQKTFYPLHFMVLAN